MTLKLSVLSVVLGLLFALPQIYGLMKPAAFADGVRKFSRSLPWGYALMLLGTAWFVWNVHLESNVDFAVYKRFLMIGFGAVGVLVCIYVKDFLAVRGLAVVFLLLAKLMLDTQRWHDSDWRVVIALWAYVLVLAGIWFTVSPWRMRDLLNWGTASEKRVKIGCAVRLAFGLFVAALGITVF